MDPPSPSKLAMSPPWKPFPLSPGRENGTAPLYGEPLPQSPSAPVLSSIPPLSPIRSPLRSPHRRNDSDVSVQGLATMFEGLEVKDPREAAQRYKSMLEKEKTKWVEKLSKEQNQHTIILERKNIRIEELEGELAAARAELQVGVSREQYEKEYKANKANVKRWEQVFKEREDQWKADSHRANKLTERIKDYEAKYQEYRKKHQQLTKENLKVTSMVPTLQTQMQGIKRNLQRAESDLRFKTEEAAKYQNQVFSLQVELEGNVARLGDELQTLKDRLRLVESERDTLKTSLKEEEVLRIAAEGQIPLPNASNDESDEFGSPVRSPRKQRAIQPQDDDKENVAPKRAAVELKFLQQELASEKRLRERAQDQIEFMKMECQFQCCSCRIAENKGKRYVHDDTYAAEMQRIKFSVPVPTPPSSSHGDDHMEGVVTTRELVDEERPSTPLSAHTTVQPEDADQQTEENTVLIHSESTETDAVVAFSPSTGTFRSVPSPVKNQGPVQAVTPAKTAETTLDSSPWTPDAHSTMIPTDVETTSMRRQNSLKESKTAAISIHEDAIEDDGEESEPPTPVHEPSAPATPAYYETKRPVTTVPLHFSPATPAYKPVKGPMTPSTVAHAAADARTPVLGELSLNKLPFDREAALEAIRQRRGRARSMAAGHGTPMKQMVEGVKDRRDISAPVSRVRR